MATNTSILGLTKPAYTDDADVAVINSNSDLIDAEAGRTRANFAAEYSNSSAYAVGAFCMHSGNLYQCNTAIGSGGEAWTAAHWTQISAGDAITASNQAIAVKQDKAWTKIAEKTISKGTTAGATEPCSNTSGYNEFIATLDIANSSHPTGFGYNVSQYIVSAMKYSGFQLTYPNSTGNKLKVYIETTQISMTEITAPDYDLLLRVYAR